MRTASARWSAPARAAVFATTTFFAARPFGARAVRPALRTALNLLLLLLRLGFALLALGGLLLA